MSASGAAAGVLLVVAGIWLLLQTLVGDLPSRIVKLGQPAPGTNLGTLGGSGINAGGTKTGTQPSPSAQNKVRAQLGLPPVGGG